jgi:hypothetical protein
MVLSISFVFEAWGIARVGIGLFGDRTEASEPLPIFARQEPSNAGQYYDSVSDISAAITSRIHFHVLGPTRMLYDDYTPILLW